VGDAIQVEEQLGLHHGAVRNDLVHFLRSWHERCVSQYVKRTHVQRLKCPLWQNLRKHVVRVREIRCEERGERSEAPIYGLPHMSNDNFAAFGHGRMCSMHEYMLKRFLHSCCALRSGLADSPVMDVFCKAAFCMFS